MLDQSQQNLELAVNWYLENSKYSDERIAEAPSSMAMDVDSSENDQSVKASCSAGSTSNRSGKSMSKQLYSVAKTSFAILGE